MDYLQNQTLNITCLILHDVDLIPENDGNFYTCEPRRPKHTTLRIRKLDDDGKYVRYYQFLVGGVLILTIDMYKQLNGFSNLYWGWGGEDDDLALRLLQKRMCIVRPNVEVATYAGKKNKFSFDICYISFLIGLPHLRTRRNNARFGLLTWSTTRLHTDGYAQIQQLTKIVSIRHTPTVTHLKLDVKNAYKKANKLQSTAKSSSLNIINTRMDKEMETGLSTTTIEKSLV